MVLNAYHPISRLDITPGIIARLQESGIVKIGGLIKKLHQIKDIEMIGAIREQHIRIALEEAGFDVD